MPKREATSRTTTSFAILGLLSVRDWTTYELTRQVRRSLNWFWPRAERKLYDEPKSLVAGGLATASKEFTGQRPRTVYSITPEGRAALRAWLDQPPAPRTTEFEGMLKVFFADAGSLEQLAATLDSIEASAAERLIELRALIAPALAGRTDFPRRQHLSALSVRLQFEQEAAVLSWARWARSQIAGWAGSDAPGDWDPQRALAGVTGQIDELVSDR